MKNLFYAVATTILLTGSGFFINTQTAQSMPNITCQCSLDDFLKGMRCCCLCLQCAADNSLTFFDKLDRIQPTLTKLNHTQQSAFVALINLCKNPNYPCTATEITILQQLGFLDEHGMLTLEPTDKAIILSLINNANEDTQLPHPRFFAIDEKSENPISEEDITPRHFDYSLKKNASLYTVYQVILPELLTDPESKQILLNFINIFRKKKNCSLDEYQALEELGLATKGTHSWFYPSCLCKQQPSYTIDLQSERTQNLARLIKITTEDGHGIVTDIAMNDEILDE